MIDLIVLAMEGELVTIGIGTELIDTKYDQVLWPGIIRSNGQEGGEIVVESEEIYEPSPADVIGSMGCPEDERTIGDGTAFSFEELKLLVAEGRIEIGEVRKSVLV